MHILIEHSALQLIRDARRQDAMHYDSWFPAVENPERRIFLPYETMHDEHTQKLRSEPDFSMPTPDWTETLESSSFNYKEVSANRDVDLSHFIAPMVFTPEHPLMLGVFDDRHKIYRKTVRTRLLKKNLPTSALVFAGRNTMFSSPELTVIQLAAHLNAPKLAQIIMELAGSYALAPETAIEPIDTAYNLEPVTTIARIAHMSTHIKNAYGRKTLNKALDLALEGSASFQETTLALMFRTPIEQGGYGMSVPVLNGRIEVPENVRKYVGNSTYYPDIFFQDCLASLEYESTLFHAPSLPVFTNGRQLSNWYHEQSFKLDKDRRRLRDLQTLGIQVIPVTAADMRGIDRLDQVAWALAQRVGATCNADASAYMEKLQNAKWRHFRTKLLDTLTEYSDSPGSIR